MKQYLKSLENMLFEENCHTEMDSEVFSRLHDMVERNQPMKAERVSTSSPTGFFMVRNACPRCHTGFPYEVIVRFCPSCGQRIEKEWSE